MSENKTIIENKGSKIDSSGIVRKGFLVGVSANILGQGFMLPEGEVLIGRDSSCGIRINDKQISGQHCRIKAGSKGIQIEDLESSNGTYLNRKKLKKPMPLNYGDRIVLGESILRLLFEEEL
ncbi:FHA domain-containing protein [Marispirochaeta sp.]|jgi:pSer/pThr/pTyr-binding forkhead associated (FHA) protein|uniref:FHA domain-containing protein n=1 Tax=Marispirochaeta sp. TaxID=2038653 RepID=UPI0029C89783|nr:FHA domain-containing protein [Marispirochaeta sp.]